MLYLIDRIINASSFAQELAIMEYHQGKQKLPSQNTRMSLLTSQSNMKGEDVANLSDSQKALPQ